MGKNVADWTKTNRRWVRGKKKKKPEQVCEKTMGGASGRWLEPEGTLKNDGVLTNMKNFKKAWFTYTGYMKREGFKMDSRLYCDMLLNQCDPSMRLTLEAIDGVHELGETKLWEKIEAIYKDSNPMYIRRLRVYELEMKKGEMTSDFATRLKLDYKESETFSTKS